VHFREGFFDGFQGGFGQKKVKMTESRREKKKKEI